MNRQTLQGAVLVVGAALSLSLPNAALRGPHAWRPHLDGPPVAHTGGFGELTCQECHAENALNAPGSILGIEGVPTRFQPGEQYRIAIVLQSDDMERAGFQAAVRFTAGNLGGEQAGRLAPIDTRTVVRRSATNGVEYVQHSPGGSAIAPGALATWVFWWTAPRDQGTVVFHVAANSANGDNSPLGDLIYTIHETTQAATIPR
jgi:hypothetical protein